MMQTILVPVLIVTGTGLIAGLLLSVASKFFAVKVDERVTQLREQLPGANCGACGCAGCDEYASKMAAGEAEPNLCPVGGAAVAAKLGEILGVSVGSIEPKRAVVKCRGHLQTSEYIMDYDGPKTCQAAKLLYDGRTSCNFACLGYGDCTRACEYDAIHIVDHIAKVNEDLCIGCSACAKVCPNSILEILPRSQKVYVTCMNHEKGADTRKVCSNGCIGCKMCEKTCKFDAIHVVDGVAKIDYDKCKNCKMCTKACPKGCIEPVPTEEEKAKFKEMQAKQAAAAKAKAEAAKQAAEAKAAEDK